ncbi:hypothetical protein M758_UG173700, partial [Ceratodon purpureus]
MVFNDEITRICKFNLNREIPFTFQFHFHCKFTSTLCDLHFHCKFTSTLCDHCLWDVFLLYYFSNTSPLKQHCLRHCATSLSPSHVLVLLRVEM